MLHRRTVWASGGQLAAACVWSRLDRGGRQGRRDRCGCGARVRVQLRGCVELLTVQHLGEPWLTATLKLHRRLGAVCWRCPENCRAAIAEGMAGCEGGRVVVGVHVLAGPLGLDICRCVEEGEV